MYAEVQFGGEWIPARIKEIDNKFVRATVIGSDKAQKMNIVGLDATITKDRAKLLDEPKDSQSLVKIVPYGDVIKHRHKRYVSALPNFDTLPPINSLELFPGISETQTELLDYCLKKHIHRAGKVDVTWKTRIHNLKYNFKVYEQTVSDGTVRLMARVELPCTSDVLADILTDRSLVPGHRFEGTEIVHWYGRRMTIRREILHNTFSNVGISSVRELMYYNWEFQMQDAYFNLRCSLEEDDETGWGKIYSDSTRIRANIEPGTGYTFRKLDDNKTEFVSMLHLNPGGWIAHMAVVSSYRKQFQDKMIALCNKVRMKKKKTLPGFSMGTNKKLGFFMKTSEKPGFTLNLSKKN